MHIIFVVGVWYFPKAYAAMPKRIEEELKKKFPDATFEIELMWYWPWQREKMRKWAEDLVEKYEIRKGNILLIGHSMGGIIATAIAPRLKNALAVVTMFAPHTTLWGLFSWMLGASLEGLGHIPVLSFQARFDGLVLWGSEYPKAIRHCKLKSDHLLWLLLSNEPAEVIANETAKLLARR